MLVVAWLRASVRRRLVLHEVRAPVAVEVEARRTHGLARKRSSSSSVKGRSVTRRVGCGEASVAAVDRDVVAREREDVRAAVAVVVAACELGPGDERLEHARPDARTRRAP